ncbi:MAG: hypothetical protein J6Q51_01455 [Clostridia bacterium]|nr:hypothetical protein [Clostridia bacterium]
MEYIIRFKETMWSQAVKRINEYIREGFFVQKVDIDNTVVYGNNQASYLSQVFEIEMIRFEKEKI